VEEDADDVDRVLTCLYYMRCGKLRDTAAVKRRWDQQYQEPTGAEGGQERPPAYRNLVLRWETPRTLGPDRTLPRDQTPNLEESRDLSPAVTIHFWLSLSARFLVHRCLLIGPD